MQSTQPRSLGDGFGTKEMWYIHNDNLPKIVRWYINEAEGSQVWVTFAGGHASTIAG